MPPAAIVQEISPALESPEQFKARTERALASAAQQLEAWIGEGLAHRAKLREAFESGGIDSEDLDFLSGMMEAVQAEIAANEKKRAATEKAIARQNRRARMISTEAALAHRCVMQKMLQLMTREHDALVEFYYFLLALRADYDPENADRTAPVLDTPEAVAGYFARLAAG